MEQLSSFMPKVDKCVQPRTLAANATLPAFIAEHRSAARGSVAEWLACWTQAQKGPGFKLQLLTVLGKLFTPIVPLFTKQRNW